MYLSSNTSQENEYKSVYVFTEDQQSTYWTVFRQYSELPEDYFVQLKCWGFSVTWAQVHCHGLMERNVRYLKWLTVGLVLFFLVPFEFSVIFPMFRYV